MKNVYIIEACYSFSFNIGCDSEFFLQYITLTSTFFYRLSVTNPGCKVTIQQDFFILAGSKTIPKGLSTIMLKCAKTHFDNHFDVFGKGVAMHCTENLKHIFPEMKLQGLGTNVYIHVSGSDL
jgi:hypothetical protein